MTRILAGAIALLLGLQADLALRMSVNWDEFYFLSQVYAYRRGELDLALNTFHVHAFQWLALVPGGEVSQVVAARLVMLALETASVIFLVRVAERFAGRVAALAAGVVYLSVGNVVTFAASFRTDPISASLLMAALWLIIGSQLRLVEVVALGAAMALAGLVTIKSAFYLPVLAVAALWRWRTAPDRRPVLRAFVIAAAVGAVTFAGLYLWHRSTLASTGLLDSAEVASGAYRKTLATAGLFPRGAELLRSLTLSPLNWLLMVAGAAMAAANLLKDRAERWKWTAALALALPIATLVFYRNAFPYYYGFILMPAAVLAAVALQPVARRRLTVVAAVAVMVLGALAHHQAYARRDQAAQRAVVAAVHRIFPRPVPYIERASMVAGFPNASFFMTSWGMEKYRAEGRPLIAERAAVRPPVFLIVSHPALQAALDGEPGGRGALLPSDATLLRENFIPHWGPIWVAGKALPAAEADQAFNIAIPGPYTVESAAPVAVDGEKAAPGAIVRLGCGPHRIAAHAGPVRLRWGDHLMRPANPPPEGQLYRGF